MVAGTRGAQSLVMTHDPTMVVITGDFRDAHDSTYQLRKSMISTCFKHL